MKRLIVSVLILCLIACTPKKSEKELKIEFTKFTLDNGLNVVFHIDRSDPVVAVALTSHVGSARELEGRTGFAHLFEHLLFLESENLGKGGLDKMSARIGGSGANGSTSRDRTNYFQTVPNDALEKMIWAEADKLGYFINTVTNEVLSKEKQVVKNEKRQSNDNRPYGHTQYVIDKNLYPKGHPYSWQVIGSLQDLQNATLQDVKDFFNEWYIPNNVTLTVAGDFDSAQAKKWVEHYFKDVKRGKDITELKKQPSNLAETKKVYHEDNFARLPELTLSWPSMPKYHADSYPLEVLTQLLTDGKKAPLNQIIIDEKKLSSSVTSYDYTSELAGQFTIQVRGFENTNLDKIHSAIEDGLKRFEKNGISESDLNRIKAGQETSFYNGISSALGKAFQLAQYQIFAGDPEFINQDVKNILAVSKDDVMRVYNTYIKEKPFVATSFVPKGQKHLILSDSKKADVTEEKIVQGAEKGFKLPKETKFEKSFSSFDRSIEPSYGKSPSVKIPNVWETKLSNELKVLGIFSDELPLVQFNLVIKGGMLLDDINKVGVANLISTLLSKGTKNKTVAELEEAIKMLGATINAYTTNESIVITGNTLSKNYDKTLALVKEMVIEPRWDSEEFNLAKSQVISSLKQQSARPNSIASNIYSELIYGKKHILSKNSLGSVESVNAITLDDLKSYYTANFSPSVSTFHIVGSVSEADVKKSLNSFSTDWNNKKVEFPEYQLPEKISKSQVYFYNVPKAKQSVIRFGYLGMAQNDKDFYPANVMNYILGGGGFASDLTQVLREGKGYTYGIRSRFSGTTLPGPFTISSNIRTNVTLEAATLVRDIVGNYSTDYTDKDHEVTQNFLLKSNARAFETLGSKLRMLQNISSYNLPYNYVKERENIVKSLSVEDIQKLSKNYLNVNKMIYLVVGDADTQMKRLEKLGFGKAILLNKTIKSKE